MGMEMAWGNWEVIRRRAIKKFCDIQICDAECYSFVTHNVMITELIVDCGDG
jgi:hypothetical protein